MAQTLAILGMLQNYTDNTQMSILIWEVSPYFIVTQAGSFLLVSTILKYVRRVL